MFEHRGKQNAKKYIKQEQQIGQTGLNVISLAIKITNSSPAKENAHDIASRFTRITYAMSHSNQLMNWNIKGTANFDGFKPLPCPTSSTFEYDYTCSGVCKNATEKRKRPFKAQQPPGFLVEITGDNGDVFYLSQTDPNQPTSLQGEF